MAEKRVTPPTTRRRFLSLLGLGAAATAAGLVVQPEPERVRRYWQVGRGAPVPSRGPAWIELRELARNYGFSLADASPADYAIADRWVVVDRGHEYPGEYTLKYEEDRAPILRQPVGVLESVNPDGTAWIRMGAPTPRGLCTCTSPWCNLAHACRTCGATGLCACSLKAARPSLAGYRS